MEANKPTWCNLYKYRITTKLNSIPEVFARGDLDYGHTTVIKHKIRLFDPTPFKQRARPIYPSDYEAVRLHLKELYEANIIRESRESICFADCRSEKEKWTNPLMCGLQKTEQPDNQKCLCFATHRRAVCIPDRSKVVFCHGLKVWLLSSGNGR